MGKDEFGSSSSSGLRIGILVVLLLVVGGAFAYDKLSVKPQFDEAWAKVKDLDADGESKTRKAVQEIIGKQPSKVENPRDDVTVETYSWTRGLPILTYDIHVVYTKFDDKEFFYSTMANKKPDETSFPRKAGQGVVINESPPEIGRAGAGAPPSSDEDKDEDKEKEDKSGEKEGDKG